ncbi:MAG: methyltransferase domain-containing protein [Acidobacteriota bacterium]|nr:methyltransferase domain-containing protein [Acidobacteriota bacterium]
MLDLRSQIALRQLVCPLTHLPLVEDGECLRTVDGKRSYPVAHGVPVLLADPGRYAGALATQAGAMVTEYAAPPPGGLRRLYRRLLAASGDQRTAASHRAFEALLEGLSEEALCLSVGGGPTRVRPEFVNLNVGAFPNVDVVADAYELPYADQAVDLIHCEAVLEHLEYPERAAAEMFRVLRAGGAAFIATPFLQPYHAYPDHFQNFTLSGHRRLFERAGFCIQEAGTCVGPTFALRDLFLNFLREVMPGGALGRWSARITALATLPLLQLDRIAGTRAASSHLASSTYLVLRRVDAGRATARSTL